MCPSLRELAESPPAMGFDTVQATPLPCDERLSPATAVPPLAAAVEKFKSQLLETDLAIRSCRIGDEDAQAAVSHACDSLMACLQHHAGGSADIDRNNGAFVFRESFPFLMRSACLDRWYTKPRGYAGDFYSIEMMYQNTPTGDGKMGRLIDRWALNTPPPKAVRNRRRMVKDAICAVAAAHSAAPILITSLASGPAREVFDVFEMPMPPDIRATCIDIDPEALSYTSAIAGERGLRGKITFAQDNVIRLAQGRGKTSLPPQHMIYSVGLIDYLEAKHVIELLNWIYRHLLPDGVAVLGNFDVTNPGRAFMDHVLGWRLIHRSPADMRDLFRQSEFGETPVDVRAEDEGVNLFAFCRKQSDDVDPLRQTGTFAVAA
jgi:extracellular factor (EF) 3-hydroxypalmitic acid methyl ester biosynthesis protein